MSGHGNEVVGVLADLVRTPSVNPALAAGADGEATVGEAGIASQIVEWCRQRGIDAWLEDVAPGRPNAVAKVGSGEPVIVLCGHIDTVGISDMTIPPFEPRIEDGRLYGRGSYDMKSGVAAIMSALAELAAVPPDGTVYGAFVMDEEYASDGAYDFVARHSADACVLTEPSEEQLILAHKGFVWLEVTVRGVASHGSRWDLGRSAVTDAAAVVMALDRYERDVLTTRTHPLAGRASLHCATIAGGEGWSTYAASCTLRVERRTLPGTDATDAVAELRDVIAATGVDADIDVVLTREPLECDPDSRVACATRDAAATVLGRDPVVAGVAYWMDAAVFAAAGIPAVNYGAGGAGAHAAIEWVDTASVERTARVLVETVRNFCSG